jgi:hypothetical protein
MKTTARFGGICFRKATTQFLILGHIALLSCKKDDVFEPILGDYYTERFECPYGATLADSFSSSTIKKSATNPKNGIEIHFISARGAFWYGQVKADSLIFPKQIVATTLEVDKGGIEIKGFGVVKGKIIDFQIEEYYIFNGYRHTCTFTATKK